MRRTIPIFISVVAVGAALFLATPAIGEAKAVPDAVAQYRVDGPRTLDDRNAVARTGAAIDEIEHGVIQASATQAEAAAIRGLGFTTTVIQSALAQPVDPAYHTYSQMITTVVNAQFAYRGLVRADTIGVSAQGRAIIAIKISDNVGVDEAEPEILFDSHLHAREHMTVEMALFLLDMFTTQYATDARIRNIVDTREIWILPDMNPDGGEYDIASGTYRSWRKNRQPNTGTLNVGTDLNRNFGYNFACCGGSSDATDSETYHGPFAFSAPETQTVRDFVLSRRVNGVQQITANIDFHSYSELILWPYGYTTDHTAPGLSADDEATFRIIGQKMANTNGYRSEQISQLYIADGDLTDWMWGDQKIWAFAFEMFPTSAAGGGFYPPGSSIPAQTARNREAVLLLSEYADCPYRAIGKAQLCSATAPVPDVVGNSTNAARDKLTAAGFATEVATFPDHGCAFIGRVYTQNPTSGTIRPIGSPVTVNVGVFPGHKCPA